MNRHKTYEMNFLLATLFANVLFIYIDVKNV